MQIRPLLPFVLMLLCACTQKTLLQQVYEWSDQNVQKNETPDHTIISDKNHVLDIRALKVAVQGMGALRAGSTTIKNDNFEITGTGVQLVAQLVPYAQQSEGLSDWMIPSDIAQKLDADDACVTLGHAGSGLYLPLKTDRLMQCAVFTNNDGDRIIAAIGFSDTFEGPDYPGSMLLIPRKKDAVVFSDILTFPLFDLWLRKKSDIFYGQHSEDNLWPPTTPAAKAFYTNATDHVGEMIAEPSKEVADGMNELEQWVNRITLD